MTKRVLIACERSGVTRRAMLELGLDAVSCDLEPADDGETERHIVGDVTPLLQQPWDLVIAHPPCTRLCNSGVRWINERNLWSELYRAAMFFERCLMANASRVAVENPVMHKYAKDLIGDRGPDFTCQPWQFGDNFKKRTCFWTKNLPPLVPTSDLDGSTAYPAVHRMGPSKDRARKRSKTYPGMAKAMAEQWGGLL